MEWLVAKMIYAINYANALFRKAQKLNTKTAYRHGVDKVFEFSPDDIDREFYVKNKAILDVPKGNGYWLWKPYFINKVMEEMQVGDWMVYADAGLYYLNNVRNYIDNLEKQGIDAICMGSKFKESHYTKRDVFVLMGLDSEEYTQSSQRGAILLLKKNNKNKILVEEWLEYAQDERIITDKPNTCGLPDYEGFRGNRHDQSIFSLLSKKYGVVTDAFLFEDFVYRKSSKALLCYHHSTYGIVTSIAFHRKFDPFLWKVKDIVKKFILHNYLEK